jgi:ubiquinone/menaquinone biosynthesis C-methylase UbiE
MPVKLDFEQKYREEADPWGIGDATADRYERYRDLLLRHARRRGAILDIGCGLGAFLVRFEGEFEQLTGVDVSAEAIRRARSIHPEVEFVQGSAVQLDHAETLDRRFDAIVFSDVINYFGEGQKTAALRWIASHLHEDGIALIAAWSPGGRYLTADEFRELVARHLVIVREINLETGHVALICEKRRFMVAITVDYETWQPIPEGKVIDWVRDVFEPGEALANICDRVGAKLTVMAEMGEYFWLADNDPAIARAMESQWRDLIARGHDVQVHLHPNWLPETGATRDASGWHWDPAYAKADAYPGDLSALLARCKDTLERICRRANAGYEAACFRAGGYQVQPFARLSDALTESGYLADSSIWSGGHSVEREHDFRHAYSMQLPYFASRFDPQLKAPPAEQTLIELPIWTPRQGRRWSFDGVRPSLAAELRDHVRARVDRATPIRYARLRQRLKRVARRLYFGPLRVFWPLLVRTIPSRGVFRLFDYGPEQDVRHEYFVAIGHTKGDHNFAALERELVALASDPRVSFVTLSDMASKADSELQQTRRDSAESEAAYQVQREYATVMGEERNLLQADALQQRIPLDSVTVLDLGCGAGDWSARIAELYPWMRVTGVDVGSEFVAKARERHASDRVVFELADFAALPFASGSFDCVYADNTLEHAFDVQKTLAEVRRVLSPSGTLVAAIPSDGRNPRRVVDNHTWKTVPSDVQARMLDAGFEDIVIDEINLVLDLGATPYPPSDNRMMYVRARVRNEPPLQLVRRLTSWTYNSLDPERSQISADPVEILRGGFAWCWGYARVLQHLLSVYGIQAEIATLWARNHARGRGKDLVDTHEVVVADLGDREVVLDPMADVVFETDLATLIRNPRLAGLKRDADERFVSRGYELYATSYLYERVFKYSVAGRTFESPARTA